MLAAIKSDSMNVNSSITEKYYPYRNQHHGGNVYKLWLVLRLISWLHIDYRVSTHVVWGLRRRWSRGPDEKTFRLLSKSALKVPIGVYVPKIIHPCVPHDMMRQQKIATFKVKCASFCWTLIQRYVSNVWSEFTTQTLVPFTCCKLYTFMFRKLNKSAALFETVLFDILW